MYRVMAADDEEIECIAIERMLRELSVPVRILASAHDGDELLVRAAKEKPDIVIVDVNMPGLSGLEAVEMLHLKRPEMKIIIHSAYHEFSYMQKAIQLGAVDYILKPASRGDVEKAVGKACRLLDRERDVLENSRRKDTALQRMQRAMGKAIFMAALSGDADEDSFRAFCDNYKGLDGRGFVCAVCLLKAETELQEAYEQMDRILDGLCIHFGTIHRDTVWFYLFSDESVTAEETERMQRTVSLFSQKMREVGMEIMIGVSFAVKEFACFRAAMQAAETAVHMADRSEAICWYRNTDRQAARPSGEAPQDWSDSMSLEELRVRNMDFYLKQTERQPYDERLAAGFPLVSGVWEALNHMETREELLRWREEVRQCADFGKQERPACSGYIRKCLYYIDQNYSRDISLNDAAAYAGVSSFYLTRLLRQELDVTFVDVLTDRRLMSAEQLLRQGELSGREIGQAVGYSNPIYFNRVFKKHTGMTVGAMREILTGRFELEDGN